MIFISHSDDTRAEFGDVTDAGGSSGGTTTGSNVLQGTLQTLSYYGMYLISCHTVTAVEVDRDPSSKSDAECKTSDFQTRYDGRSNECVRDRYKGSNSLDDASAQTRPLYRDYTYPCPTSSPYKMSSHHHSAWNRLLPPSWPFSMLSPSLHTMF